MLLSVSFFIYYIDRYVLKVTTNNLIGALSNFAANNKNTIELVLNLSKLNSKDTRMVNFEKVHTVEI